jgi:hypothetical protein
METTPYGVKETPKGWEVWQFWHGRKVSGPFSTREEAERAAERAKRGEK